MKRNGRPEVQQLPVELRGTSVLLWVLLPGYDGIRTGVRAYCCGYYCRGTMVLEPGYERIVVGITAGVRGY